METVYRYDKGEPTAGVGEVVAEAPLGPGGKIPGVTGVILAGGASSRMKSNKALLLHSSGRIIEGIYRRLAELFEEVIVVTNTPQLYEFLPCRKVPDIYPGKGVVAGIHAGLSQSREDVIFVAACDMPHLQGELIRYLTSLAGGVDMVLPATAGGKEPLHAVYGKGCLPALEELLQKDEKRVLSLLPLVRVRQVTADEVAVFDHEFESFININTPDDYYRLRSREKEPAAQGDEKISQSS